MIYFKLFRPANKNWQKISSRSVLKWMDTLQVLSLSVDLYVGYLNSEIHFIMKILH